jgi:hypothetical protein
MPKLYQILRQEPDGRWRFVAHGARYSVGEAADVVERIARFSGDKTRILLCGKDRT